MVTAQKDRVLGDFGGVFTFGGNLMERKSTGVSNSVSALTVPDLFWLTNSTTQTEVSVRLILIVRPIHCMVHWELTMTVGHFWI